MKFNLLAFVFFPILAMAQNVGIGTTTPTGPLSFSNILGNKIVFWGEGNVAHYGMGVQAGLLQIYASQSVDAVAIGTGRSNSFSEVMRVSGNGNVGIRTSSPGVRLDVGGGNNWDLENGEGDVRIGNSNYRLKFGVAFEGGGFGAAGIMQAGGIGLLSIGAAGKYMIEVSGGGSLINFKNINNGLRINGNAGTAGQLLTSGGPNAAPTWSNISVLSNNFYLATQSSNSADLVSNANYVDLPGMAANFTLTVPSRVVFNYRARVRNRSCFACGDKRSFLALHQRAPAVFGVADLVVYTPNGEFADAVSGPVAIDLNPGTYSFQVALSISTYGTATVYAEYGWLSWQLFPR